VVLERAEQRRADLDAHVAQPGGAGDGAVVVLVGPQVDLRGAGGPGGVERVAQRADL
jgi:hypothetical protein